MPVYKFRSVEALNRELWRAPGDPDLYRAMAGLWAAGARVRPRALQPGVYRYRTIEDLDAATPKWRDAAASVPQPDDR